MQAQDTKATEYADRLVRIQKAGWKQSLKSLNPYRLHLAKVAQGETLEVGCGIGRVLDFLGSRALGVDHNPDSVAICKAEGFRALTSQEFFAQQASHQDAFDTLLTSHLMEHMSLDEGRELLVSYLPSLRSQSRLVLVTPQEVGYRSDASHVEFIDFAKQRLLVESCGFAVKRQYSFPFPRPCGKLFIYNEFVTIAERSAT